MKSKTNWDKLSKMTDDDIKKVANGDPDGHLLTQSELKRFKRVNSTKEVDVKMIRNKLNLTQEKFAWY